MNITGIKYFSTVNGNGIRTAVFVAGCNLHCEGCFNTGAWSFKSGKPITPETIDKIIESIEPEYISGLSILGGEPLDPLNQDGVYELIKSVKDRCPNKSIWLWTGYTIGNIPMTSYTIDILNSIDVLVDGPFIPNLRFENLRYRGSANQRIIDMKHSTPAKVTLLEEY